MIVGRRESERALERDRAQAERLDRPIEEPNRGGPDTPMAQPPERQRATADVWVKRPDLGDRVRVLVRAGELIPLGLEAYEREPVQPGEVDFPPVQQSEV